MDLLMKLNPFTKSAVEMALWDIAGKAWACLSISCSEARSATYPHQDDDRRFRSSPRPVAGRAVPELGRAMLKVKVGMDLAGDVARVEAVREVAGPDIPITIDANCGWNVTTARVALDRLRRFDLLVAEQPIAPGDTEAMASLRHRRHTDHGRRERFHPRRCLERLRAHAADVISIYPGKNGGIAASVEIAQAAAAAGIACHVGSNLELGIGSAAMLHLACAVTTSTAKHTRPISLARIITSPTCWPSRLISRPDGARVPEGPGLGVTLDEEQLGRFRVD